MIKTNNFVSVIPRYLKKAIVQDNDKHLDDFVGYNNRQPCISKWLSLTYQEHYIMIYFYTLSQVSTSTTFCLNIDNHKYLCAKTTSIPRKKKVQLFCFETPPWLFQVSIHKSAGILHFKRHEKNPDDNIEKLSEAFRVLIGERFNHCLS